MMNNCVAYYRVSTDKQGKSGLGLEAQKHAVETYLNRNGWNLVKDFTEVETGKGRNALKVRPQLDQALKTAKKEKAILIIAKLDRLARNVAFISNLMESGVDFMACDIPNANKLTIHILAAVAEDEAVRISERTKAAFQQLKENLKNDDFREERKAKGKSLQIGNPQSAETLNKNRIKNAASFAESMRPAMTEFKNRNMTQRQMVIELNNRQIKAPRGGEWSLTSVQNCLKRLGLI